LNSPTQIFDHDLGMVVIDRLQRVESHRPSRVCGIEDDYVTTALGRHPLQDRLHQITFRIQQNYSQSSFQILHRHIDEQRALSGPGGSEHLDMTQTSLGIEG
jgi:hypothetical protein